MQRGNAAVLLFGKVQGRTILGDLYNDRFLLQIWADTCKRIISKEKHALLGKLNYKHIII